MQLTSDIIVPRSTCHTEILDYIIFFVDATAQIGIWILLIGSVFVLDDITVDIDKAGQTEEGDLWYPITLFKDSSAICYVIGFALLCVRLFARSLLVCPRVRMAGFFQA